MFLVASLLPHQSLSPRNEIIPWFRDPEFRFVIVDKILKSCADDPRRNASNRKAAKPLVPLGLTEPARDVKGGATGERGRPLK